MLQPFQDQGHKVHLQEFLNHLFVLDVIDNIADSPYGLFPHFIGLVSPREYNICHDLIFSNNHGFHFSVGSDVGNQPESLFPDLLRAVCENVTQFDHKLFLCDITSACLLIYCEQVTKEPYAVGNIFHLEFSEDLIGKSLQSGVARQYFDMFIIAIFNNICDHGHNVRFEGCFVGSFHSWIQEHFGLDLSEV